MEPTDAALASPMADYRLYFLDPMGRIRRGEVLTCAGDEEAIRLALEQHPGAALEIWQRGRMVVKIEGRPS